MKEHWSPALRITLILLIITCGIYPMIVYAIGRLAFRDKADGSLVVRNGQVIGSSLIGQAFGSPRYFHPRPSAAGSGYDPLHSGGSNLGPTSKALRDRIAGEVARAEARPVPADAVTASGSGLDPHISPENARMQAPRIAKANGMTGAAVRALIDRHVEGRFLGIYGEPRVNVLALNRELAAARP